MVESHAGAGGPPAPAGGLGALVRSRAGLTALAALAGVVVGGVLHVLAIDGPAHAVWAGATAILLLPLSISVARSVLRGDLGVDAVALVSMVGALALGEYLAGAVVALMLAGGNALEDVANRRARRELTALVQRAPRFARVVRHGGFEEVPVAAVGAGEVVLVRGGEVVPVDGVVEAGEAVIDESALTGEPLPVTVPRGGQVRSGVANAGEAFELRSLRPAAESAYAALVRLVANVEHDRAPFVRMADRYAALLLPVTAIGAAVAWAVSGDPVRALAVFVVATPCPLILAAPVALISGLSRAARAGVVVKSAVTIEKLGGARTMLLDKTGTITLGHPELTRVVPLGRASADRTLFLAASLDQLSAHPLAAALVTGARERGLELASPSGAREVFGRGIEGIVDGQLVAVGTRGWLREQGIDSELPDELDGGAARVLVAVDGELAGALFVADRLRDDASELVPRLRAAGIEHVALVTGDKIGVAEEIGATLGVDRVYAEQTPEQKLDVVRALQAQPGLRSVVMVGDGINDAPALALADIGIAMGAIGATVSSETADAVILVDRIDRVAEAVRIGRRSLGIARQSVLLGLGASFVAMAFAGAGFLPPVHGALLQEVIDVAVILNALRALRP